MRYNSVHWWVSVLLTSRDGKIRVWRRRGERYSDNCIGEQDTGKESVCGGVKSLHAGEVQFSSLKVTRLLLSTSSRLSIMRLSHSLCGGRTSCICRTTLDLKLFVWPQPMLGSWLSDEVFKVFRHEPDLTLLGRTWEES